VESLDVTHICGKFNDNDRNMKNLSIQIRMYQLRTNIGMTTLYLEGSKGLFEKECEFLVIYWQNNH
jgi:hypothetical protein